MDVPGVARVYAMCLMDSKRQLFRQAALEKMASLDHLDETMEVTSPAGWVALLTLGAMLAAAILWSFYGQIPISVHGNGILIRGEAVAEVTAEAAGRIASLSKRPGDRVEVGEVVALIHQPELELRIENAREQLETLRRQSRELEADGERLVAQRLRQRTELEKKQEIQKRLVEAEVAAPATLLDIEAEIGRFDQALEQARHAERVRRAESSNRIDALRQQLGELQRELEARREVRSPYRGRVLELMAHPGILIAPGTRLLTLEEDEPINAVIYLPAAEGKKVHKGMPVRVSPATVKAEEYGQISGEVDRVSEYPVTPEGMNRVLSNEKLVQTLTAGGPRIEVVVSLHEDPETVSRFAWTSSAGPPLEVTAGTPCSASVLLDHRLPISYVLPIFKKALGRG